MRIFPLLLIVFMSLVISPTETLSQEKNDWEFDLAPFYIWVINIDGDVKIRGNVADASLDAGEIWNNLEGVFTTRFNAVYREKFGVMVDYNYLDLGKEPVTIFGTPEIGFTSQVLNIAGTYRLMQGQHTFDFLAGIRYNNLDADIVVRAVGVTLDGDQDWVDPIVGLRYNFSFSDKWSLRLLGDVGGFGVSSDFTWQGLGMIDYQPWKNVSFVAGYRAIGTDYTTGSGASKFRYDATAYGPLVGLDISW